MACLVEYVQTFPPGFPKDELDAYRVERTDDGYLYLRFDLHRQPQYVRLGQGQVTVYSEYLKGVLDRANLSGCSEKTVLQELIYWFTATYESERSSLLLDYVDLLDRISEGELKDTTEIRDIRRRTAELYSDTLSLYHITRRLSVILE
jgi:hypothetical protein